MNKNFRIIIYINGYIDFTAPYVIKLRNVLILL